MKVTNNVEDFVQDPSFQAWVHGDLDAGTFWTDWLTRYPNQQQKITQARLLVRALERVEADTDDDEVERQISLLLERTRVVRPSRVIGDTFTPAWLLPDRWLRVMAMLLTALGMSVGHYLLRQADETTFTATEKPIAGAASQEVDAEAAPSEFPVAWWSLFGDE